MHSSYDLRQNNSDTVNARSMIKKNLETNLDQSERLYVNAILSSEEIPFRSYFEQITNIFAREGYEIWIKQNFQCRDIAVVVVKRSYNTVVAIVWLKHGFPIDNPLKQEIIDKIRENLALNIECEFNNAPSASKDS